MGGSNRKGVLVTGACGFIGSHLCERLVREKYGVTAIDSITDYYDRNIKWQNLELVKKNPNLHFRKLDVLDVDHIDNSIEYVFHAAAQPGVRASWGKDFDTYARDNILATQHILELCKEKKELKKFIYSSSSSIYGDAETYPTKEETIPKPVSPYGVTKLAGEHLCQLYHKNYGIPVVCLRYFTVFGPRQRPDMAFHKFIKAMLNNEPIMVFGDGEQT
ncbi:NAD-dependent epimerase/dehydratase family protein, partial [bacterium]|nr:NAD-dependent epimerase/dehydratase family protein [bacterium]